MTLQKSQGSWGQKVTHHSAESVFHLSSSDTTLCLGIAPNPTALPPPPPESSPLAVLLDLSLARSVAVHAVHLEVSFAVTFDQRSGEESHEGDREELSQRPPGEDVVQGMDL